MEEGLTRPPSGAVWLSPEEFEDAVADALDRIPQQFLDRLDNVVFKVEPEPTPDQLRSADGGELLGLYVGVAQPDRGDGYGWGALPDQIFIFSGPIQRVSASRQDVVDQIHITVVHEIGHHFGVDDARLHELGWG